MKKYLILLIITFSTVIFAAQKVYVTPKGKKYHSIKSCKTLSRSKRIIEIDISKVGSRKPCKVCN